MSQLLVTESSVPVGGAVSTPNQPPIEFLLNLLCEFTQDGITATPSGTQANSVKLTTQTVRVVTVATAGDGVVLPPSQAGLELLVINHGANPMTVFGAGTDNIDDIAGTTGVLQMQNSAVIYICATAGNWYSEGLATGFGGSGLQTLSQQDGLTAKAGGGQGGGPTINRMLNRVATVATIGDSITLPASKPGMQITVYNGAANSMNVFPATGETINALAANAAFAVAGVTYVIFTCFTAGAWFTK